MKVRILGIVLLAVCVGFTSSGFRYAKKRKALPPPSQQIPLGEKLVYKIAWLGIPVGTGELWVKEKTTLNGREVFHVVGKIETNKVLRTVFPMQDEAQSWIDVQTLESLQFEKTIDELIINTHERMTFDGAAGKGYFESLKDGHKEEFNVLSPVFDVISVTYWVRRQTLVAGQTVTTALTADRKIWRLEAHVAGIETLKQNGKKINVVRVQPDTVVEGEEKRGKANFYLSADPRRVPVKITYKAPFGKVTGTLVEEESRLLPNEVTLSSPADGRTR